MRFIENFMCFLYVLNKNKGDIYMEQSDFCDDIGSDDDFEHHEHSRRGLKIKYTSIRLYHQFTEDAIRILP